MLEFTYPRPPRTVAETEINEGFLINLVAKILHSGGTMTPGQVADEIKLPRMVVRQLMETMVKLQMLESQGLESDDIKSDIRYSLTDRGTKAALEALLNSAYVGPAPVTLPTFDKQIRTQSIHHEQIHRNDLERALSHLVIPSFMMDQLGPAANSGRSVLLYGEPGNGKTSIAEALVKTFNDTIFIPYAIFVGNQLIRFFDETIHEVVDLPEGADPLDPRWVPIKRPVVVTGGELTLDKLDLKFEEGSRFYEAPMHLKALGGIFIIDDFGRQTRPPQEFLNRWIVPLEKNFDILSLHTGKKFYVPFDQLVIFSTNMLPEKLGDGAALRRIYFKIFVPSPTKQDYLEIFERICDANDLTYDHQVLSEFYDSKYEAQQLVTSGAHPGFLVNHIISASVYMDRTPVISHEMLELAWRNVAVSKKDVL